MRSSARTRSGTRRAQLKKDLKGGGVLHQALLLDPPEVRPDGEGLRHAPGRAEVRAGVKVNKVLQQCRISPSKTIGGPVAAPAQRARRPVRR
jgi:hypothetical protein